MKAKLIPIFAGLAIAASAPGTAVAGGDYYGGAVSGVAVPAPIPAPVYDPVWYFRLDAGIGTSRNPSVSEEGIVFGEQNGDFAAEHTFGSDDNWGEAEYAQDAIVGGGFGYRFSEHFRMDMTAEFLRGVESHTYAYTESPILFQHNPIPIDGKLRTTFADETKITGGAYMVNAYYDLGTWHRVVPYVGGGLGFANFNIDRRVQAREIAVNATTPPSTKTVLYDVREKTSENETTLAAMATAGMTYKLSDITDLDLNYRYMYISGVNVDAHVNGFKSIVTIDDMHDHQLRAGLRFNVN